MRRSRRQAAVAAPRPQNAAPDTAGTLFRVAWLAILLGITMEAVLIVMKAVGDAGAPGPFMASTVQNVSWSVFVCLGIAVGTTTARARPAAMGAAGLLAAPLAFYTARSVHKGALQVLAAAGTAAAGPSPLLLALIKAIEYGTLGASLGWISTRPWGGAVAHLAAGLITGVVFGGTIVALQARAAPDVFDAATITSRTMNEILFPTGCAFVIFVAETFRKRTTA